MSVSARVYLTSVVSALNVLLFQSACVVDSGIELRVTLGPTCPVQRPGMQCERPYPASIAIYSENGHLLKIAHTAGDGRLRVRLRPGTYELMPRPADFERPYPRAKPVSATVSPGSYSIVRIQYDTGIR